MARYSIFFLASLYSLLLAGCIRAQDTPIPLQHTRLKDKVVANNLAAFLATTVAPLVDVSVSRWGDGYSYHLSTIPSYVDYIEDFPARPWAEWKGHLIFFNVEHDIRQDDIYTITDSTAYSNLLSYIRCILPRLYTPSVRVDKKNKGAVRQLRYAIADGGRCWKFGVVKGKEVFFIDDDGYRFDDIIDITAPESASTLKP